MTPLEKHIHSVCDQVVAENKTTDKLSENDLADLPIGVVKQIGNSVYVIAIDSAYWDGRGWFFSAYASVKFPGASRPIAFRAQKVGFNKGGLASLSETKLVLAAPQWITLSDDVVLELPADGRNFVEFDCEGFKSVNLKGNFHFTGQLIVPAQDSVKNVTASFEINTTDLSNVMATVNITPFRIRGLKDISFEVKNAVADYSDFVNPAGFAFPVGYDQPFGDSPSLWRGFFLQELKIEMTGLTGKDNKPLTLQGQNLIIDDLGISGSVMASNLLSLREGSADGWPLSINSLAIKLLHNSLAGGSMAGNLVVPFLGKDSLAYTAELEQVQQRIDYKFSIATASEQEFSTPFSAKIKLLSGSTITLEKKDGVFTPSTLLHGTITVQNGKMKASGIKFQNLGLTSRHPYIISGDFSTEGEGQSTSVGFPVRIDDITMKVSNGQVSLGFGIGLNFMNTDSRGISASTSISIAAKLEAVSPGGELPARQEWKYDGIKINDIMLDCNTTAFTLKGKLTIFDDDPQFGDGFRGNLTFALNQVLKRGIQVNAYFGSKDDFRYWHFDAYIPTGAIPIVPPPLSINGFIGGASYKMTRSQNFKPDFSKLGTPVQSSTEADAVRNSATEFAFVPDANAGLSFMAGVTLIAGSEKAFNSDAVLEVAFNASGGFRYVQFKGSGYFLSSVDSRSRPEAGPERVQAPVFADMNMIYDNENKVFHGNLQVYMNLKDKIHGTGPNNMMGEAVIHIDENDWYIYIGRPSQMLGVDIAGLAVAQGYFMVGSKLEPLPPPPPELQEIMEDRDLSLVRDENTLKMGNGFAMGARFQAGFDSKDKIRPFYVALTIGAGTDLMIRDFGNATCEGSDGPIGFDGWYASGQTYVFLKGKVGVKVKGHKFDFLSLGAAALLQAKLPNPTWLKGQLAGKYSVMGGLVSGKFNVKLIIGEECEIVTPGSELGDIMVISDITPDAGSNDVSVFASPQVSFNTAIDTELTMLNNKDEVSTYRVRFDEFQITNNGQPIIASRIWNTKKDVLALETPETLPPQTLLKASAKVHWEKKLSNGTWEPLKENNVIDYETKEITFTTGTAPDFIPDENVAYSYPIKHQYNFLISESGQGYVKLRKGQSYLFQPSDNNGVSWAYLARFEQHSGNRVEVPVSYNSGQSIVNFTIPPTLAKQTVYTFSFIRKPASADKIDANVTRDTVSVNGGAGNEVNVASNTLEGTITQDVEKAIYASAFRTSKFGTFTEKWSSLSSPQDLFDVAIGNIAVIGKGMNLQETFDDFELKGSPRHNKPLVQVSAAPENSWMQNNVGPLLYDSYPVDPSVIITRRNTDSLGVKPLHAVQLRNVQENYILDNTSISSGVSAIKSGPVKLLYFVSYVSFWDYDELRNKAARLSLAGNRSAGITRLLSATGYIDLMEGAYPINISYTLPGTNQVTTQKQITIQF